MDQKEFDALRDAFSREICKKRNNSIEISRSYPIYGTKSELLHEMEKSHIIENYMEAYVAGINTSMQIIAEQNCLEYEPLNIYGVPIKGNLQKTYDREPNLLNIIKTEIQST